MLDSALSVFLLTLGGGIIATLLVIAAWEQKP
ncbi:hypothetical protein EV686_102301 [Paracandidimonas soli]|uniref:Uncharacterized protein n=1 Tax=Paracandidimonas soli TaxID=1917182 RepID=A0A4R3VD71_9BURK|nr:hypothetical protein EV686_102301 [Paracandidimonas soli]